MATAVSTQLSALTGSNTVQQMMSDVNSLKTLSALATDAAGSGDFVPTTGGNFTGNVGIGASGTETRQIDVGTGRTDNGYAVINLIGDATYTDYGAKFVRGNTGPNSTTQIRHKGTGNFSLITDNSANIRFLTNLTERVRITNSGKVGIGTNNPGGALEVYDSGDSRLKITGGSAAFLRLSDTGGSTDAKNWDLINDGGQVSLRFLNDSTNSYVDAYKITRSGLTVSDHRWYTGSGVEKVRIDNDGQVDIGAQAPINGGRYVDITNTNGSATDFSILRLITQQVGSSSTTSADLFKRKNGQLTLSNNDTDSAAYLSLQVGASESMRVTASGHVLVGTASPTTDLPYQKKLKISGPGVALYLEETDESQAYSICALSGKLIIRDATNSAARMTIANTGDMTFHRGVVNLESTSGNPAQMNFYCESGNAHYTRIQSAPHASYSGNVVLTLPTTSGTLATTGVVATTGKSIAMAIVFG